ncbi:MAG: hypothetical protein JWN48_4553 [Myxococcaceae bacterium]|nr:hypothetical protein [Myxococcaceae bacterium]
MACYTAFVPYIEPEEYRPEPPLRAEITGPIAWEDPSLSWPRRLFATLAATFAPLRTIHAVADGRLTPALVFALITAGPFMWLWALIPYTHTLRFDPSFGVVVLPHDGPLDMLVDILRAAGIGFTLSMIALLSWALPFTSLVQAFSNGSRPEAPKLAAWRTTLYRTWIMPLGITLLLLTSWGMPKDPNPLVPELAFICLQILPRILILVHCHTMARYFGASGFGALIVSGVPVAVQLAVDLSVHQGAAMLLPPMPES